MLLQLGATRRTPGPGWDARAHLLGEQQSFPRPGLRAEWARAVCLGWQWGVPLDKERGQGGKGGLEEPRGQGWQAVIRGQHRGDGAWHQGLVLSTQGWQVVTKAVPRGQGVTVAGSAKGTWTAACTEQSRGQLRG